MSVAVGTAIWLALVTERAGAGWLVLGLGLAGAAAVALALARPPALGAGLVLLTAGYGTLLAIDEPPLDGRAAILAAALIVVGELAAWSVELRTTSPDEPGGAERRLPWIALEGIGALAVTGAVLALVDLARTEGVVVEIVGAVSALATLVLVARLAAQRP